MGNHYVDFGAIGDRNRASRQPCRMCGSLMRYQRKDGPAYKLDGIEMQDWCCRTCDADLDERRAS